MRSQVGGLIFLKNDQMNYIFVLISTLFCCNVIAGQKADYYMEYSFQCIKDTISNEYSYPDEYVLYRMGDETRFMNKAQYYNDSINMIFERENPQPSGFEMSQEKGQRWMQSVQEYVSSNNRSFRSELYISRNNRTNETLNFIINSYPRHYMSERLVLDWTILQERKTIRNIDCIKATTTYGGRFYTAWFAPNIPINDGPYVFHGLPGLIIRVVDKKNWYVFELNRMTLTKSERFWTKELLHKSYPKISRSKYVQLMLRDLNNPAAPFGVLGDTEELKIRLKEKRKGRFDLLIEQLLSS